MLTLAFIEGFKEQLRGDLGLFRPELTLCVTVMVMLGARTLPGSGKFSKLFAAVGTTLALLFAASDWSFASAAPENISRELFQGSVIFDSFTAFMRGFLIAFTLLVIFLGFLTRIPDEEDAADFYTLLLGSVVGMCLMASANNILMVFLSVEMASVPSYAMAGFLKGRRQSSEAALKYVVYGGAAAGVMLYGLSLLAGIFGSIHLPTLAHEMLFQFSQNGVTFDPALMLALMLTMAGFAFKLSAFPFHFWCPDVFEGAAAEVAGFLSIASKGAAIALLARLSLTFVGEYHDAPFTAEAWAPAVEAMGNYVAPTLAVMAAVTSTFGNLAAYGQTNVKRLLAYSTIAHAGYMLMALVPMSLIGVKAALFYLVAYLFMNLGAFAVVAFVRNQTGGEELKDFRGLIHRAPFLTISMSVFLFSLIGLPPMVGFVGKFQIFAALYETGWYSLLIVGGINTVFSLFYYVNLMRVMIMEGEPTKMPAWETMPARFYVTTLAILTVFLGIDWNTPENWVTIAANSIKPKTATVAEHQPKLDLPQNAAVLTANQPAAVRAVQAAVPTAKE